jgi:predicted metal-dependent phosphoesterase TrpH
VLEPASELHPHLRDPRPPGTVRVDMHSHTCYSGDAVTTLDELAERVESSGIDVLCVTDHHAIKGAQEAIARDIGCRIVVGEEVKTRAGEIIGLFITERVPHGLAPEETIGRIRDQGGIVYVPHPFDPVRHALRETVLRLLCADGAIDTLEVFNAKVSLDHLNRRAADLAEETGLPGGAGSDAHDPAAIGAAYVEMPDFDGPREFLDRLQAGRIVGHRFDRARPFTPRIIPSGLTQA